LDVEDVVCKKNPDNCYQSELKQFKL